MSPISAFHLPVASIVLITLSISFGAVIFSAFIPSKGFAKSQSEARQEAFLLEKKGRERFVQKEYLEAIKLWRQAFDTYQDNKLLFFIASTYGRLEGECEAESKAWDSYLGACKEGSCPNKERGLQANTQFKTRCYRSINISSNAPKAVLSLSGENWGILPFSKALLVKRYEGLKISAQGYLSQKIDLDLSSPSTQNSLNVTLTAIPPETFFEKHQLKIAISTAIVGVSVLSLGLLQLSSSSSISQEVNTRAYPSVFESQEEQSAAKALYESDKERYESAQLWGGVFLTTGVIALGAGAWMLFYKGPNAAIHEKARQQGDEVSQSSLNTDWSVEPLYTNRGSLSGAHAWWKISF